MMGSYRYESPNAERKTISRKPIRQISSLNSGAGQYFRLNSVNSSFYKDTLKSSHQTLTGPTDAMKDKFRRYSCSAPTSEKARIIAYDIKRHIVETKNQVKRTPNFVKRTHRNIIYLHNFNCRVAQISGMYPLDDDLKDLLVKYIELEMSILNNPEYNTDMYRMNVEMRLMTLIKRIYSKYCFYLNGKFNPNDTWQLIFQLFEEVSYDVHTFFEDMRQKVIENINVSLDPEVIRDDSVTAKSPLTCYKEIDGSVKVEIARENDPLLRCCKMFNIDSELDKTSGKLPGAKSPAQHQASRSILQGDEVVISDDEIIDTGQERDDRIKQESDIKEEDNIFASKRTELSSAFEHNTVLIDNSEPEIIDLCDDTQTRNQYRIRKNPQRRPLITNTNLKRNTLIDLVDGSSDDEDSAKNSVVQKFVSRRKCDKIVNSVNNVSESSSKNENVISRLSRLVPEQFKDILSSDSSEDMRDSGNLQTQEEMEILRQIRALMSKTGSSKMSLRMVNDHLVISPENNLKPTNLDIITENQCSSIDTTLETQTSSSRVETTSSNKNGSSTLGDLPSQSLITQPQVIEKANKDITPVIQSSAKHVESASSNKNESSTLGDLGPQSLVSQPQPIKAVNKDATPVIQTSSRHVKTTSANKSESSTLREPFTQSLISQPQTHKEVNANTRLSTKEIECTHLKDPVETSGVQSKEISSECALVKTFSDVHPDSTLSFNDNKSMSEHTKTIIIYKSSSDSVSSWACSETFKSQYESELESEKDFGFISEADSAHEKLKLGNGTPQDVEVSIESFETEQSIHDTRSEDDEESAQTHIQKECTGSFSSFGETIEDNCQQRKDIPQLIICGKDQEMECCLDNSKDTGNENSDVDENILLEDDEIEEDTNIDEESLLREENENKSLDTTNKGEVTDLLSCKPREQMSLDIQDSEIFLKNLQTQKLAEASTIVPIDTTVKETHLSTDGENLDGFGHTKNLNALEIKDTKILDKCTFQKSGEARENADQQIIHGMETVTDARKISHNEQPINKPTNIQLENEPREKEPAKNEDKSNIMMEVVPQKNLVMGENEVVQAEKSIEKQIKSSLTTPNFQEVEVSHPENIETPKSEMSINANNDQVVIKTTGSTLEKTCNTEIHEPTSDRDPTEEKIHSKAEVLEEVLEDITNNSEELEVVSTLPTTDSHEVPDSAQHKNLLSKVIEGLENLGTQESIETAVDSNNLQTELTGPVVEEASKKEVICGCTTIYVPTQEEIHNNAEIQSVTTEVTRIELKNVQEKSSIEKQVCLENLTIQKSKETSVATTDSVVEETCNKENRGYTTEPVTIKEQIHNNATSEDTMITSKEIEIKESENKVYSTLPTMDSCEVQDLPQNKNCQSEITEVLNTQKSIDTANVTNSIHEKLETICSIAEKVCSEDEIYGCTTKDVIEKDIHDNVQMPSLAIEGLKKQSIETVDKKLDTIACEISDLPQNVNSSCEDIKVHSKNENNQKSTDTSLVTNQEATDKIVENTSNKEEIHDKNVATEKETHNNVEISALIQTTEKEVDTIFSTADSREIPELSQNENSFCEGIEGLSKNVEAEKSMETSSVVHNLQETALSTCPTVEKTCNKEEIHDKNVSTEKETHNNAEISAFSTEGTISKLQQAQTTETSEKEVDTTLPTTDFCEFKELPQIKNPLSEGVDVCLENEENQKSVDMTTVTNQGATESPDLAVEKSCNKLEMYSCTTLDVSTEEEIVNNTEISSFTAQGPKIIINQVQTKETSEKEVDTISPTTDFCEVQESSQNKNVIPKRVEVHTENVENMEKLETSEEETFNNAELPDFTVEDTTVKSKLIQTKETSKVEPTFPTTDLQDAQELPHNKNVLSEGFEVRPEKVEINKSLEKFIFTDQETTESTGSTLEACNTKISNSSTEDVQKGANNIAGKHECTSDDTEIKQTEVHRSEATEKEIYKALPISEPNDCHLPCETTEVHLQKIESPKSEESSLATDGSQKIVKLPENNQLLPKEMEFSTEKFPTEKKSCSNAQILSVTDKIEIRQKEAHVENITEKEDNIFSPPRDIQENNDLQNNPKPQDNPDGDICSGNRLTEEITSNSELLVLENTKISSKEVETTENVIDKCTATSTDFQNFEEFASQNNDECTNSNIREGDLKIFTSTDSQTNEKSPQNNTLCLQSADETIEKCAETATVSNSEQIEELPTCIEVQPQVEQIYSCAAQELGRNHATTNFQEVTSLVTDKADDLSEKINVSEMTEEQSKTSDYENYTNSDKNIGTEQELGRACVTTHLQEVTSFVTDKADNHLEEINVDGITENPSKTSDYENYSKSDKNISTEQELGRACDTTNLQEVTSMVTDEADNRLEEINVRRITENPSKTSDYENYTNSDKNIGTQQESGKSCVTANLQEDTSLVISEEINVSEITEKQSKTSGFENFTNSDKNIGTEQELGRGCGTTNLEEITPVVIDEADNHLEEINVGGITENPSKTSDYKNYTDTDKNIGKSDSTAFFEPEKLTETCENPIEETDNGCDGTEELISSKETQLTLIEGGDTTTYLTENEGGMKTADSVEEINNEYEEDPVYMDEFVVDSTVEISTCEYYAEDNEMENSNLCEIKVQEINVGEKLNISENDKDLGINNLKATSAEKQENKVLEFSETKTESDFQDSKNIQSRNKTKEILGENCEKEQIYEQTISTSENVTLNEKGKNIQDIYTQGSRDNLGKKVENLIPEMDDIKDIPSEAISLENVEDIPVPTSTEEDFNDNTQANESDTSSDTDTKLKISNLEEVSEKLNKVESEILDSSLSEENACNMSDKTIIYDLVQHIIQSIEIEEHRLRDKQNFKSTYVESVSYETSLSEISTEKIVTKGSLGQDLELDGYSASQANVASSSYAEKKKNDYDVLPKLSSYPEKASANENDKLPLNIKKSEIDQRNSNINKSSCKTENTNLPSPYSTRSFNASSSERLDELIPTSCPEKLQELSKKESSTIVNDLRNLKKDEFLHYEPEMVKHTPEQMLVLRREETKMRDNPLQFLNSVKNTASKEDDVLNLTKKSHKGKESIDSKIGGMPVESNKIQAIEMSPSVVPTVQDVQATIKSKARYSSSRAKHIMKIRDEEVIVPRPLNLATNNNAGEKESSTTNYNQISHPLSQQLVISQESKMVDNIQPENYISGDPTVNQNVNTAQLQTFDIQSAESFASYLPKNEDKIECPNLILYNTKEDSLQGLRQSLSKFGTEVIPKSGEPEDLHILAETAIQYEEFINADSVDHGSDSEGRLFIDEGSPPEYPVVETKGQSDNLSGSNEIILGIETNFQKNTTTKYLKDALNIFKEDSEILLPHKNIAKPKKQRDALNVNDYPEINAKTTRRKPNILKRKTKNDVKKKVYLQPKLKVLLNEPKLPRTKTKAEIKQMPTSLSLQNLHSDSDDDTPLAERVKSRTPSPKKIKNRYGTTDILIGRQAKNEIIDIEEKESIKKTRGKSGERLKDTRKEEVCADIAVVKEVTVKHTNNKSFHKAQEAATEESVGKKLHRKSNELYKDSERTTHLSKNRQKPGDGFAANIDVNVVFPDSSIQDHEELQEKKKDGKTSEAYRLKLRSRSCSGSEFAINNSPTTEQQIVESIGMCVEIKSNNIDSKESSKHLNTSNKLRRRSGGTCDGVSDLLIPVDNSPMCADNTSVSKSDDVTNNELSPYASKLRRKSSQEQSTELLNLIVPGSLNAENDSKNGKTLRSGLPKSKKTANLSQDMLHDDVFPPIKVGRGRGRKSTKTVNANNQEQKRPPKSKRTKKAKKNDVSNVELPTINISFSQEVVGTIGAIKEISSNSAQPRRSVKKPNLRLDLSQANKDAIISVNKPSEVKENIQNQSLTSVPLATTPKERFKREFKAQIENAKSDIIGDKEINNSPTNEINFNNQVSLLMETPKKSFEDKEIEAVHPKLRCKSKSLFSHCRNTVETTTEKLISRLQIDSVKLIKDDDEEKCEIIEEIKDAKLLLDITSNNTAINKITNIDENVASEQLYYLGSGAHNSTQPSEPSIKSPQNYSDNSVLNMPPSKNVKSCIGGTPLLGIKDNLAACEETTNAVKNQASDINEDSSEKIINPKEDSPLEGNLKETRDSKVTEQLWSVKPEVQKNDNLNKSITNDLSLPKTEINTEISMLESSTRENLLEETSNSKDCMEPLSPMENPDKNVNTSVEDSVIDDLSLSELKYVAESKKASKQNVSELTDTHTSDNISGPELDKKCLDQKIADSLQHAAQDLKIGTELFVKSEPNDKNVFGIEQKLEEKVFPTKDCQSALPSEFNTDALKENSINKSSDSNDSDLVSIAQEVLQHTCQNFEEQSTYFDDEIKQDFHISIGSEVEVADNKTSDSADIEKEKSEIQDKLLYFLHNEKNACETPKNFTHCFENTDLNKKKDDKKQNVLDVEGIKEHTGKSSCESSDIKENSTVVEIKSHHKEILPHVKKDVLGKPEKPLKNKLDITLGESDSEVEIKKKYNDKSKKRERSVDTEKSKRIKDEKIKQSAEMEKKKSSSSRTRSKDDKHSIEQRSSRRNRSEECDKKKNSDMSRSNSISVPPLSIPSVSKDRHEGKDKSRYTRSSSVLSDSEKRRDRSDSSKKEKADKGIDNKHRREENKKEKHDKNKERKRSRDDKKTDKTTIKDKPNPPKDKDLVRSSSKNDEEVGSTKRDYKKNKESLEDSRSKKIQHKQHTSDKKSERSKKDAKINKKSYDKIDTSCSESKDNMVGKNHTESNQEVCTDKISSDKLLTRREGLVVLLNRDSIFNKIDLEDTKVTIVEPIDKYTVKELVPKKRDAQSCQDSKVEKDSKENKKSSDQLKSGGSSESQDKETASKETKFEKDRLTRHANRKHSKKSISIPKNIKNTVELQDKEITDKNISKDIVYTDTIKTKVSSSSTNSAKLFPSVEVETANVNSLDKTENILKHRSSKNTTDPQKISGANLDQKIKEKKCTDYDKKSVTQSIEKLDLGTGASINTEGINKKRKSFENRDNFVDDVIEKTPVQPKKKKKSQRPESRIYSKKECKNSISEMPSIKKPVIKEDNVNYLSPQSTLALSGDITQESLKDQQLNKVIISEIISQNIDQEHIGNNTNIAPEQAVSNPVLNNDPFKNAATPLQSIEVEKLKNSTSMEPKVCKRLITEDSFGKKADSNETVPICLDKLKETETSLQQVNNITDNHYQSLHMDEKISSETEPLCKEACSKSVHQRNERELVTKVNKTSLQSQELEGTILSKEETPIFDGSEKIVSKEMSMQFTESENKLDILNPKPATEPNVLATADSDILITDKSLQGNCTEKKEIESSFTETLDVMKKLQGNIDHPLATVTEKCEGVALLHKEDSSEKQSNCKRSLELKRPIETNKPSLEVDTKSSLTGQRVETLLSQDTELSTKPKKRRKDFKSTDFEQKESVCKETSDNIEKQTTEQDHDQEFSAQDAQIAEECPVFEKTSLEESLKPKELNVQKIKESSSKPQEVHVPDQQNKLEELLTKSSSIAEPAVTIFKDDKIEKQANSVSDIQELKDDVFEISIITEVTDSSSNTSDSKNIIEMLSPKKSMQAHESICLDVEVTNLKNVNPVTQNSYNSSNFSTGLQEKQSLKTSQQTTDKTSENYLCSTQEIYGEKSLQHNCAKQVLYQEIELKSELKNVEMPSENVSSHHSEISIPNISTQQINNSSKLMDFRESKDQDIYKGYFRNPSPPVLINTNCVPDLGNHDGNNDLDPFSVGSETQRPQILPDFVENKDVVNTLLGQTNNTNQTTAVSESLPFAQSQISTTIQSSMVNFQQLFGSNFANNIVVTAINTQYSQGSQVYQNSELLKLPIISPGNFYDQQKISTSNVNIAVSSMLTSLPTANTQCVQALPDYIPTLKKDEFCKSKSEKEPEFICGSKESDILPDDVAFLEEYPCTSPENVLPNYNRNESFQSSPATSSVSQQSEHTSNPDKESGDVTTTNSFLISDHTYTSSTKDVLINGQSEEKKEHTEYPTGASGKPIIEYSMEELFDLIDDSSTSASGILAISNSDPINNEGVWSFGVEPNNPNEITSWDKVVVEPQPQAYSTNFLNFSCLSDLSQGSESNEANLDREKMNLTDFFSLTNTPETPSKKRRLQEDVAKKTTKADVIAPAKKMKPTKEEDKKKPELLFIPTRKHGRTRVSAPRKNPTQIPKDDKEKPALDKNAVGQLSLSEPIKIELLTECAKKDAPQLPQLVPLSKVTTRSACRKDIRDNYVTPQSQGMYNIKIKSANESEDGLTESVNNNIAGPNNPMVTTNRSRGEVFTVEALLQNSKSNQSRADEQVSHSDRSPRTNIASSEILPQHSSTKNNSHQSGVSTRSSTAINLQSDTLKPKQLVLNKRDLKALPVNSQVYLKYFSPGKNTAVSTTNAPPLIASQPENNLKILLNKPMKASVNSIDSTKNLGNTNIKKSLAAETNKKALPKTSIDVKTTSKKSNIIGSPEIPLLCESRSMSRAVKEVIKRTSMEEKEASAKKRCITTSSTDEFDNLVKSPVNAMFKNSDSKVSGKNNPRRDSRAHHSRGSPKRYDSQSSRHISSSAFREISSSGGTRASHSNDFRGRSENTKAPHLERPRKSVHFKVEERDKATSRYIHSDSRRDDDLYKRESFPENPSKSLFPDPESPFKDGSTSFDCSNSDGSRNQHEWIKNMQQVDPELLLLPTMSRSHARGIDSK